MKNHPTKRIGRILSACAVLAVAGCGQKQAAAPGTPGAPGAPGSPTAPIRKGPPPPDNDKMMKPAMTKARQTVKQFIAALAKPKPNQKGFVVKKRLTGHNNIEHVWLTNVVFKNGVFSGKMTQDSLKFPEIKQGSSQTVKQADISDWMFIQDGKLVGGYTLRAIRASMPPKQRALLDKSLPFKVE